MLSPDLAPLEDDALLAEVMRLARCERKATAELIARLAELDARRLHLGAGFSSLFAYCTAVLRLSEHEAYNRIEAARAARRFPVILDLLRNGSVNLTTIRLLSPHLDGGNHEELLAAAGGKSRRQVEELLAGHFPSRPVVPVVRKLPDARSLPEAPVAATPEARTDALLPAPSVPAPVMLPASRRPVVAPLSVDAYRIAFTASAETHRKLREAQDLLRHQVPDGNPAEIFDRALSALLEKLASRRLAATSRPRPSRGTAPASRHIPAEVKRAVWLRDGGRCAFVAKNGRRCSERGFLEFHHRAPHAVGGESTPGNIALRCRPHNGYEAEIDFGPRATRSRTSYGVPSDTTKTVAVPFGGLTPQSG